jgi:hypothetical protein
MLQLRRHLPSLAALLCALGLAPAARAMPAACDALVCISSVWGAEDGGNGHAYVYVPDALVLWTEANESALVSALDGIIGHLATLTTSSENAFVVDRVLPPGGTLDPAGELDSVWLGALQLDTPASPAEGWTWWTLESFDFAPWAPGEPNDEGSDERFLALFIDGVRRGSWNDENIGWVYNAGYIVEFDTPLAALPEPGALLLLLPALAVLVRARLRRAK